MGHTIFRAGTHRTVGGRAIAFSEGDLAATVAAYDPALHEAPVVTGHRKTDDPAMGWGSGLHLAGPRLEADFHQLDPAFAEAPDATGTFPPSSTRPIPSGSPSGRATSPRRWPGATANGKPRRSGPRIFP